MISNVRRLVAGVAFDRWENLGRGIGTRPTHKVARLKGDGLRLDDQRLGLDPFITRPREGRPAAGYRRGDVGTMDNRVGCSSGVA